MKVCDRAYVTEDEEEEEEESLSEHSYSPGKHTHTRVAWYTGTTIMSPKRYETTILEHCRTVA